MRKSLILIALAVGYVHFLSQWNELANQKLDGLKTFYMRVADTDRTLIDQPPQPPF